MAGRRGALPPAVQIEPGSGTVYAWSGTAQSQTFTIWNLGATSAAYSLSASCLGSATSCAAAASVTIAAGATAQVPVTFTASGAGTVRLTATNASTAESVMGSVDVQVVPITMLTPMHHLCMTAALPGGGASECGDLRLAHPLPAVRTLNQARTPVLLYNSGQAEPWFRAVYTLTLGTSNPVPADSVTQTYTLASGRVLGRQTWSGWPSGERRRLLFTTPLRDVPTGLLSFTVQTVSWRGGVPGTLTQQFEIPFINRSSSSFGAGWWLAGLEEIQHLADGRKLWIGGDGSAMVYRTVNDSTWAASNPERPDTMKKRLIAGVPRYVRLLPGGAHVVFGTTGRQDSTVNRLGHVTSFWYGEAGLDSINVPGGAVYRFKYGPREGAQQRLWRVTLARDTMQRAVVFGPQDGDPRIRTIQDPDGLQVDFDYASADTSQRRITRRLGQRRLTWASYTYDGIGKLTRGQLDMGAAGEADDIILAITPGESRGAAPNPVRTDSVYTLIDGPRPDSDVIDRTRFWITSAHDISVPERIADALGNETVITRGDARFPALVTRIDNPLLADGTRSSAIAAYDARGNGWRRPASIRWATGATPPRATSGPRRPGPISSPA